VDFFIPSDICFTAVYFLVLLGLFHTVCCFSRTNRIYRFSSYSVDFFEKSRRPGWVFEEE